MKFKVLATTAIVASLTLVPVSPLVGPARADSKDVVAGLIIGGIVGAAINEGSKKKKSSSKSKSKSKSTKEKSGGISAEQKAANIEVQDALNYFGWNVGTADGAIGPKSRSAIGEYQVFLGHGSTGELSAEERTILVTAHARAKAGGAVIQDIVSSSVYGVRGVILTQRDEMAAAGGTQTAAVPGAAAVGVIAAAVIPGGQAEPAPAPEPAPVQVAVVPAPEVAPAPEAVVEPAPVAVAAAEEPALPSFMDVNGAKGSLATACNDVMLTTNANGGYQTADTMMDASLALSEQFCLTRASAIKTGQQLAAKVAGFTPEQIAAQCAAFGPVLKDQVAALSLRPADEVLAGVEAFILQSGMSPAQLSGTAKVCLGVGYQNDTMDVAIGSALLLAAMGEAGYAELLGHHLSQGFGATQRADLALGWYDVALGALRGGTDVFAPGVAGREDLILRAAYTAAGRGAEVAPQPLVEEASLPAFEVAPEAVAPEMAAVAEAAPLVPPVAAVTEPAPDAAPAAVAAAPEPAPLPVPEPAPAALAEAPEPAPLPLPEPAPEDLAMQASPEATGPGGEVMRVGAEAAIAAARLPFFLFAAY